MLGLPGRLLAEMGKVLKGRGSTLLWFGGWKVRCGWVSLVGLEGG